MNAKMIECPDCEHEDREIHNCLDNLRSEWLAIKTKYGRLDEKQTDSDLLEYREALKPLRAKLRRVVNKRNTLLRQADLAVQSAHKTEDDVTVLAKGINRVIIQRLEVEL